MTLPASEVAEKPRRRRWGRGVFASLAILIYFGAFVAAITDERHRPPVSSGGWTLRVAASVFTAIIVFLHCSRRAPVNERKRVTWARRAVFVFVLLLPLQYVLSVGPVEALFRAGYVSPQFRHAYRAPLGAIPYASGLGRLIEGYLRFWTV